VFGSVAGFTAYTWLLRNAPLPLVTTYAFVNPMVAVTLGALFLGEQLSIRTAGAGVAFVTSVLLIVRASSRARRPGALRPGTVAAADDRV
jgi:drug/metabolite transporter (DMT)-like permease